MSHKGNDKYYDDLIDNEMVKCTCCDHVYRNDQINENGECPGCASYEIIHVSTLFQIMSENRRSNNMLTEKDKIENDLIIDRIKNDIRDIIRYAELSLNDIRNDKIDQCIGSDMVRIKGIADDVILDIRKLKS